MAGLTSHGMLERKPRYKIRDGQNATVVLERAAQSDRPALTASLIDLAESGAKLSASSCIPIGEFVQLRLMVEQLESEFQSAAEVCWNRPGKDGEWLVACAFRPQVPKHIFDTLAACGVLERRESERRYVSLPVTVRWELDEESDSARLQDFSDGGFSIVISHAIETGRRLSMVCEGSDGEPLEVRAKVQWTLRTPEQHLIGCSMLHDQDFGCLRSLEC